MIKCFLGKIAKKFVENRILNKKIVFGNVPLKFFLPSCKLDKTKTFPFAFWVVLVGKWRIITIYVICSFSMGTLSTCKVVVNSVNIVENKYSIGIYLKHLFRYVLDTVESIVLKWNQSIALHWIMIGIDINMHTLCLYPNNNNQSIALPTDGLKSYRNNPLLSGQRSKAKN